MNGAPQLLAINESFLDKSVKEVTLSGFQLSSRRDRPDGSGGGVVLFVANSAAAYVTLLAHSETCERSWHVLHTDLGPVLFCVWYRPPAPGDLSSIKTFEREWVSFRDDFVGTILVGDLNLHHTHWLRYSSHVSVEGTTMFRFCRDHGFKQYVKKATRENHLLDLFISDLDEVSSTHVLPRIADHHVVRGVLRLQVPCDAPRRREVWVYKFADWSNLRETLVTIDWSFIDVLSVDDATEQFTNSLLEAMRAFIPTTVVEEGSSHPWLNERCVDLIRAKHESEGTTQFPEAATACSAGILEEYNAYIQRLRVKLRRARRGSKLWWRLADQIAHRSGGPRGIPALKRDDGTWVLASDDKANLLADTFCAKSGLPRLEENEYSRIGVPLFSQRWLSIRERNVRKILRKSDLDSGTGPDDISTRVLLMCAFELALPIAKITRRILSTHRWPERWILHRVVALHKRNSVSDPEHYRGVHMTSQVSKVVERVLSDCFSPLLERNAFGDNQFAYRKKHGARDAVAFYVCSWLLALCRGCKVGIYCSDVSGAFDRVSASRLIRKLAAMGVHSDLLGVFRSWLRDRKARVVVAGAQSAEFILSNMVFQGIGLRCITVGIMRGVRWFFVSLLRSLLRVCALVRARLYRLSKVLRVSMLCS